MRIKLPITKSQFPNKFQVPIAKPEVGGRPFGDWLLDIGDYLVIGICDLVIE